MNNRTLTSANSVLLLTVGTLFPAPVRIQGFSADDITDMDSVEPKETSMGIDGRLSAGYMPVPINQSITLQADSLSNDFFEQWALYERTQRETLVASGSLSIPATGVQYIMTRGFLRGYKPIPGLGRTLKPRAFTLVWEKVTPAPNF